MKQFAGKVAAVTGAGSGIGRALALELAQRKCHLSLCDIDAEALQQTVTEVNAFGVNVTSRTVDVAQRDAVYEWAEATVRDHGKVNLVFNNAGVALVTTVEGADYAELEWIMGINFWGVVYGTKAFLPHLKAAGEGHIINLSSVFGIAGIPGQCGYNAAKFAVRGFTECLREELDIQRCGVSASSVHPGGIKTNIARRARNNGTVAALGMDIDPSGDAFEKAARTTPAQAAQIILRGVEKNKRRILVGPDAHVIDWIVRIFPSRYQGVVIWLMRKVKT